MRMFTPATRYPADPRAVFVLTLCVVSGIPLLILKTSPGSLEEALPSWGVFLWGLGLLAGSITTLAGMAFQTGGGILAEQVGSAVVGIATLFYVGIAILELGPERSLTLPMAIILGWGLSCLWRWGQLQALITQTARTVERVRAEHKED